MRKENTLLIKQLIHGYSIMQETPKDTQQFWYKQTQEVKRYFEKRKPEPVNKKNAVYLQNKMQEIKELDIEYFDNKEFSPYMVMIMLLDYLIRELKDIEMRSKFIHYNTKKIIAELEIGFAKKEIVKNHHRYISKVLEKLN